MLRRRLDLERHGSDGYTRLSRVVAIVAMFGFFGLATQMGAKAWFDGRILPGVVVGGQNLGGMTLEKAREVLQNQADRYRLEMDIASDHYKLMASQLGVTFDTETTLENAYRAGRDGWFMPLHMDPLPLSYRLDRAQLNAFATGVATKVGTPPIDAGVVLKANMLTPVPDKSGWTIDRIGLLRLIEADVASPGGQKLVLKPREQVADIQVGALEPTIQEAKRLMATPVILTYGDKTFTPTPNQIGHWLAFQKQPDGMAFRLVPQIDVAELKDYVQDIADKVNVAPVNKRVNVENGVSKVMTEGVDGTAIDQDAVVAAVSAAVTAQQPLTFVISSHVVPFKTISTTLVSLDYGRYIEISLSKQHLWVWQDHTVIYESAITSGATGVGLGTVTGLFSIYYKTTNTRLRGQGYDVPVKYWMPFYLGYGLHDAVWRHGKFGGSDYYYGGSHGCVNLPDATAEFIYGWADVGTPVWVHN